MNKFLTVIFVLLFFIQSSFCQLSGKIFSGTLESGSTANSVIVAIKPNSTFSGQFTNIQFTIQIPATLSRQPIAAIVNNPLSKFIPSANYTTAITNENGFYNYLFSATLSGSSIYNFNQGQEIQIIEIAFSGDTNTIKQSRLAHLPDGGSKNKQMTFYVEISGNDNTHYSNMFYGNNAVNTNSYFSYSFVSLQKDNAPEYIAANNATSINNTIKALQQIESFANSSLNKTTTPLITNLYPNPTHDFLYINFDSKTTNERSQIFIYDQTGKLVKHYKTNGHVGLNTFKADVKEFPSGIYELKFITGTNQKISHFIKI